MTSLQAAHSIRMCGNKVVSMVEFSMPNKGGKFAMYFSTSVKFSITLVIAVLWLVFCSWASLPWTRDLAVYLGKGFSIFIIASIALIPGFMQMFLFIAFVLDRRPINKPVKVYPPLSIIIAAYNEEGNIGRTLRALSRQNYPGEIEIIIVDDGSTDKTVEIINNFPMEKLRLIKNQHGGKAACLNHALKELKYDLVVCLDADTLVSRLGVMKLVERFLTGPPHTAAVAGTVLVKNCRTTFAARLQQWDYFLAITAIKRVQSLFQGTLVAQGAFSLYVKKVLNEVNGWPNVVGEDIVMSWAILKRGYRIDFSEEAICFTAVPETYKAFFLQRSRWARGLIEAFKAHPSILIARRQFVFLIYWNLLFPILDLVYLFIFLPGVILAFCGYTFIAGPMTLAALPLAFLYSSVFFSTNKKVFNRLGFKTRKDTVGLVSYLLFYQLLMVPACIYGYMSEFFLLRKRWGR